MNIHTFTGEAEWQQAALQAIVSGLPKTGGHLGLSGGSASQLYPLLTEENVDWASQNTYLCDERYVTVEHCDSNQKLIQETFQTSAQYHFWPTELPWEECATEYAKVLPGQLDVAVLGIGPDGHFASVFPNNSLVWSLQCTTTTSTTNQFAVPERLSMTPMYLARAKKVIVLMVGAGKQPMIDELQSPTMGHVAFPAHWLRTQAQAEVFWLQ